MSSRDDAARAAYATKNGGGILAVAALMGLLIGAAVHLNHPGDHAVWVGTLIGAACGLFVGGLVWLGIYFEWEL